MKIFFRKNFVIFCRACIFTSPSGKCRKASLKMSVREKILRNRFKELESKGRSWDSPTGEIENGLRNPVPKGPG